MAEISDECQSPKPSIFDLFVGCVPAGISNASAEKSHAVAESSHEVTGCRFTRFRARPSILLCTRPNFSHQRPILRTGFFALRQAIEWQQFKNGGYLVAVEPAYTSRECPACGCTDKKNRPRQALFQCICCGYENNADIVGAINVRRKGRTGPSAHDQKRIAREVSSQGLVPFARSCGANSENPPERCLGNSAGIP